MMDDSRVSALSGGALHPAPLRSTESSYPGRVVYQVVQLDAERRLHDDGNSEVDWID